ncbi:hypothetical protein DEF23_04980 [Marinitenerispora sediminis]|uniref:Uncharacterized protein n=1 Tax=Marinitenerispora sediminis TaxID=1931232 RepID=A0A368T3M6_9ACTN|nr:hypothetical protein DEF28_07065 [Marinitenerispora sediminis]RCV57389.1 hypothetical protein DEF24_15180 [Marinitenerispora sediminis]RCV60252.1 hypothetical protein DEF23_04980 [Marinitenerispora sediminis]
MDLESVLADDPTYPPQAGGLSDPARHVISRRHPTEDRPLTFSEAAADWEARFKADPGTEFIDVDGFSRLAPFASVILPGSLYKDMGWIQYELDARVAPGRPACVIGDDAADLSLVLHEVADALRSPETGGEPTPHPGTAPWIARESVKVSDRPDLAEHYEHLRRAARRAAELIPSHAELRAARDFSVSRDILPTAATLVRLADDDNREVAWEKAPGADPGRHLVWGDSPELTELKDEAATWREHLRSDGLPRTPVAPEPQPQWDGANPLLVMSKTRSLLYAEVLDELAARLYPGRSSGMIHYDGYWLTRALQSGVGYELRGLYWF